MEHLLKIAVAQGPSAIGSLVRAWMLVEAALWAAIGFIMWSNNTSDMHPIGKVVEAAFGGALAAGFLALPVAGALILIHIARKW